ncbi:pilus assembly protein [Sulfuriflexus sp.]|uniref:pilus assembly PilX family protein n=1 Tax=Sulfuriflexus sp. TaxID=2015443 RepID=UPI0028CCE51C|nr:pilus assembly protein [Sulfuriflexus sp.]MDT8403753.1 pilus assembly protein [Sulfuriflexus sp.]
MSMMPTAPARQQQGAVLIISMIILLLLTILGVTSMQGTNLEERMAGNMRDRHVAFESAEATLAEAEAFLDTIAVTSAFRDNTAGLYDGTYLDLWKTVDWADATKYRSAANITTSHGVSTAPKYIIEYISEPSSTSESKTNLDNYGGTSAGGGVALFRITVRGTGGSDNSVVFLQTVYGVSGVTGSNNL